MVQSTFVSSLHLSLNDPSVPYAKVLILESPQRTQVTLYTSDSSLLSADHCIIALPASLPREVVINFGIIAAG